jgi:hypothetical protein
MSICLYHFSTVTAEVIEAEGFRAGEDGVVWLSPGFDACGHTGHRFLEVTLDATEDELARYEVPMADSECLDDEDRWVKLPEEEIVRYLWYAIPASDLNAKMIRVRNISDDEDLLLRAGFSPEEIDQRLGRDTGT